MTRLAIFALGAVTGFLASYGLREYVEHIDEIDRADHEPGFAAGRRPGCVR